MSLIWRSSPEAMLTGDCHRIRAYGIEGQLGEIRGIFKRRVVFSTGRVAEIRHKTEENGRGAVVMQISYNK